VPRYRVLRVTEAQRQELTRRTQSRTLPAGDLFRAKVILALADGRTRTDTAAALGTSKKTIALWKARFEEAGIAGLEARHKGSRLRAATLSVQARVARRVQEKPPDGSTHWSCRKLAADLGMSHATVQRILAKRNYSRIGLIGTWRATILNSSRKQPTSLACISIRPNTRQCSALTRRLRFERSTASIRGCHCRRDAANGADLNITGTPRYRYMRRWM
jgi:transposase